ncbi:ABC transporter ATP-binding protein [Nonomuraea sp. NBC_01738]|uniref:ABC transporter ATP-binding protein n=1 Tax=Nonomuraea sp. NBC_01738 TaxID=2976003 RepID=UPI002E15CCFF|nr:ABC transporter ATP-binding protein [Nonomuraea sp. NBC_01738]
MLDLREVSVAFGALTAVDRVTLRVARGERRALIGPNGAGKSTLFATIAGALKASSGTISFDGNDVTRLGEPRRARLGITRTFQHSSLFDGLSCLDNVALAVRAERGVGLRAWLPRAGRADVEREAARHLELMRLEPHGPAGDLPHGGQRRLEVAMALARKPRLLLLDEPAAGMSAAESAELAALIRDLPAELTVLVVEHDLDVVFAVASHVSVLAAGSVIADGSPEQVRASAEVQRAYLGT